MVGRAREINLLGLLFFIGALGACFYKLGRHDEALVLRREVYARRLATLGNLEENTILAGCNVVCSLINLELWDEVATLSCLTS